LRVRFRIQREGGGFKVEVMVEGWGLKVEGWKNMRGDLEVEAAGAVSVKPVVELIDAVDQVLGIVELGFAFGAWGSGSRYDGGWGVSSTGISLVIEYD